MQTLTTAGHADVVLEDEQTASDWEVRRPPTRPGLAPGPNLDLATSSP